MNVLLAQPRGFCAGVARAIEIAERALETHGAPVYVYHEIVHNGHVVGDLASRGAIFVDDIAEIPEGSLTIFSAHGVANAVVEQAARRRLQVIDATCPLVTKVHVQAERYSQRGHVIVVIGHAGHEEVEGTRGSVSGPVHVVGTVEDIAALPMPPGTPVAYVTQTTLSLDDTRVLIEALERRYPDIGWKIFATPRRIASAPCDRWLGRWISSSWWAHVTVPMPIVCKKSQPITVYRHAWWNTRVKSRTCGSPKCATWV
jgi:4-hydroxy-3-methylbut-2-enyl diphosphate reductase